MAPGGLTKDKPLPLNWVNESLRVLGIFISYNDKGNNKKNVLSKIDNLNTKLDIWRSRKLSLFGKCLIVKSLGISQFVYSASMLDISAEDTSRIKKYLFNFRERSLTIGGGGGGKAGKFWGRAMFFWAPIWGGPQFYGPTFRGGLQFLGAFH